jgi:hypothetical protein
MMPKLRVTLILLISTLLVSSCHDTNSDYYEYEPGTVLMAFKAETSLRDAVNFLNERVVGYQDFQTIYSISSLPADSLEFVRTKLATKPYLMNGAGAARISYDGSIWVNQVFIKWDLASLNDWVNTCDELKLKYTTDTAVLSATVTLKVKPGTENTWVIRATQDSRVIWAQLRCINCILYD